MKPSAINKGRIFWQNHIGIKKLVTVFALFFSLAAFAFDRDPTRPFDPKEEQQTANATHLKADAVILAKERKLVLINGHYFTIGDELMRAKIVAIGPKEIILKNAKGEELRLPVFETRK